MDHVAIMKKSWGLTQKILSGKKKIESRWYKAKHAPWDIIKAGDTIYFKDSGEPVTIKAEVDKVVQFSGLNPGKVKGILETYGNDDGIASDDIAKFFELFRDKKYCMLIYLKNPKRVKPFNIDKSGFGLMAAWITVQNINQIRVGKKKNMKIK